MQTAHPLLRAGRGRSAGIGALFLVCLLALAACSNGTGAGAADTPQPPQGLGQYYQQEIDWRPCRNGFQCGQVRVPLDYDKPNGRSIQLAVIRLPATNPDQRIGSLLTNPGGPGASGIKYARQARRLIPAEVRARFDIVGFDPRGVGRSAPVQCVSANQLDRFLATDASPNTQQERQTVVRTSRTFARECGQQSGKLLPHVGTMNAARDMDVLRSAVGDAKLNFLGISYGTLLGAAYATLFPNNVRALVLDGAVDPTLRICI